MKNIAFEAVCKFAGSQKKLADRLGVTPGFISQVVNGRRPVPIEWCPVIEEMTGGMYLCEFLRPDVKWGVVRRTAAAAAPKMEFAQKSSS